MRLTPYSFLTDTEFIRLLEERASSELEVEARQRLRVHVEHVQMQKEPAPLPKYLEQAVTRLEQQAAA